MPEPPNVLEMELAVVNHFNPRQNIIVPNVSWGLGLRHEADLVVLRPSGYAIEVEIKRTASDIKADARKGHNHQSTLFRQLWFAVPQGLQDHPAIPTRAGVLYLERDAYDHLRLTTYRAAKPWSLSRKWTNRERDKLLALGNLRVWTLKRHLWQHIRGEHNA